MNLNKELVLDDLYRFFVAQWFNYNIFDETFSTIEIVYFKLRMSYGCLRRFQHRRRKVLKC